MSWLDEIEKDRYSLPSGCYWGMPPAGGWESELADGDDCEYYFEEDGYDSDDF